MGTPRGNPKITLKVITSDGNVPPFGSVQAGHQLGVSWSVGRSRELDKKNIKINSPVFLDSEPE